MRSAPPWASLWAFHVVAETGSLTAAATALDVTQPAVSKRLRELELHLGCALVRRGANAIVLTEAGRQFAARLEEGFGEVTAAVRALKSGAAPLRIRAYTTWALRWLIPRLPDFRRRHPGIDVEVGTSNARVNLVREDVDAAVSAAPCDRPPTPASLRLQPVTVAPFAAPALAAGWRSRDRVEGTLLGSKVRRDDWSIWLRGNGLGTAAAPLLFESTTLAIQAAVEGLGLVICAPDYVRGEVAAGRLVPLPGEVQRTGACYWLVLPDGRIGAPLRIFAEWLRREATEDAVGPGPPGAAGPP